jgi:hypothetical protein
MSPRDVPHRIRLLGESDVRGLFDTPMALELARSMLRTQATDGSRLSTPSASFLDATELGGPMFKFKAAAVGEMRVSGIRLIARRSISTRIGSSASTRSRIAVTNASARSARRELTRISAIGSASASSGTSSAATSPDPKTPIRSGPGRTSGSTEATPKAAVRSRESQISETRPVSAPTSWS